MPPSNINITINPESSNITTTDLEPVVVTGEQIQNDGDKHYKKMNISHDGHCVMLILPDHPGVAGDQNWLRYIIENQGMTDDTTFIDPSDFHVTLAYGNGGNSEQLRNTLSALQLPDKPFMISTTGPGIFDTPDGYALHLTVDKGKQLSELQARVYQAMVESGFTMPEYSNPSEYTPHITLAYTPEPIEMDGRSSVLAASGVVLVSPEDEVLFSHDFQKNRRHFRHDETVIAFGGSLKALENNEVGGYLVKFTSPERRDLYNEYFNDQTQFLLNAYPVLNYNSLYQHGLDPDLTVIPVGQVTEVKRDNDGIFIKSKIDLVSSWQKTIQELQKPDEWKRKQLEIAREYQNHIMEMVNDGLLSWSSGALPQGVDVDEDGHIKQWPIIEASLTPNPAEPEFTKITTVKSLELKSLRDAFTHEEAHETSNDSDTQAPPVTPKHETDAQASTDSENSTRKTNTQQESKMLTKEEMQTILTDQVGLMADALYEAMSMNPTADELDATMSAMNEEAERMADEDEDIKTALESGDGKALRSRINELLKPIVKAQVKKLNDLREDRRKSANDTIKGLVADMRSEPARGIRETHGAGAPITTPDAPAKSNVRVGDDLRYSHMKAEDMAAGVLMLEARAARSGIPASVTRPSDDYIKHMTIKAHREVYEGNTLSNATAGHLKNVMPYRADELNATDVSGQGLDWVGNYWSSVIWEKARTRRIFRELMKMGMMNVEWRQGYGKATIPLEGNDPIVYGAGQAKDMTTGGRVPGQVAMSPFGTGNIEVEPGELRMMSAIPVTLQESSIVDAAAQLNRQMPEKMEETIEQLMLNADSDNTASTNINLIDGTPWAGSGAPYDRPYYLEGNGFRKLALITAPAASVTSAYNAAGAGVSPEMFKQLLTMFPNDIRTNRDKMAFVVDPDTFDATEDHPIFRDDNNKRSGGTWIDGTLEKIHRVRLMQSGFLPLSNTAGKVSGTPANNLYGTILAIYVPFWAFVFARDIDIITAYDIYANANVFACDMRFGFEARGTSAARIAYNVAV